MDSVLNFRLKLLFQKTSIHLCFLQLQRMCISNWLSWKHHLTSIFIKSPWYCFPISLSKLTLNSNLIIYCSFSNTTLMAYLRFCKHPRYLAFHFCSGNHILLLKVIRSILISPMPLGIWYSHSKYGTLEFKVWESAGYKVLAS